MKAFIRKSFTVLWYRGSRKLVTAHRQNYLVLVGLLYSRASSSCHLVKLPVSPLCISCKVSPLFEGNVIRTNGPFLWWIQDGRCDFPVDCGNSIEVHNGTGPSAPSPPFQASWLLLNSLLASIPSWYLCLQSSASSHAEKWRCRQLRKAPRRHLVIYLGNFLSPCPWCVFLQR